MSVKRVGVEATYTPDATVSGYGTYTKGVLNKLVEMSNNVLEFVSANYDTVSRYSAYYRIKGTKAGIFVDMASNDYKFRLNPCEEIADNTFKVLSSAAQMNIGNTSSVCEINFCSIGDFFYEIRCSCGSSTTQCWIGWGTCSANNDAVRVFGAGGAALPFSDNGSVGVYALVNDSGKFGYFLDNGTDSRKYQMAATGHSYALTCHSNYWRPSSGNDGYSGYIKWGGLYDMYILYDSANPIATIPCRKYILDGVEYVSTGNYLLIPVIAGTNTIA